MKRIQRKSILWLLIVVLAFGTLLAACGSNNNNDTSPDPVQPSDPSTPTEEVTGLPMVDGKYDPPVRLTTVRGVGPNVEFVPGESIEDNVHTRWALERLGIEIDHLWTTSTLNEAFETRLMLSLSANQELPDIVNVPIATAHELIDSGRFRPIGDLFDQYASDVWKEAMADVPEAWIPYTRDGERYGIPSMDYIRMNDTVMWIRQDWLDDAGLQAPTTIAEMETVMEAFVNRNPSNNIGISLALSRPIPNAWVNTAPIFGAFGAVPEIWKQNESGELEYQSLQPEVKEALAVLRDWMERGFIHPEAGIHDEMKAAEEFMAGRSGIMFGPTWAHAWPLNATTQNDPNAVIRPYPIPTGPNGEAARVAASAHHNVTLINKDMEHPEIFFTYMNYLYENYANPAPGGEFEFGLAEGYDYVIVDGEVLYGDDNVEAHSQVGAHKQINVENYALTQPITRIPSLQIGVFAALADGAEPQTPFEARMKSRVTPEAGAAAKVVIEQSHFTIQNQFRGEPTPTMLDRQELLTKMEQEAFSRIIYGRVPLDEFDKFVQDWKSSGGDRVTNEVNEWYRSLGLN